MSYPDNIEMPTDYDYKLTFLGEPMAQQRHRSVIMPRKGTGKRALGVLWYRMCDLWTNMYDPSKNDKRDLLRMVAAGSPRPPLLGPLRVDVYLFWAFRKSDYRTGKYSGELKPGVCQWKDTGKDRDNCDKLVLDALTGTFWKNDSQVVDGRIAKRYSEQPRTVIFITHLIGKELQDGKETAVSKEVQGQTDQHNSDSEPDHGGDQERQDIFHGNEPLW